jgi:site-specific recombinase XerD
MNDDPVTLDAARTLFAATLSAKSPRTAANYHSALNRFWEFMREGSVATDTITTASLKPAVLEEFYTWLLSIHGRQRRSTANTYVAGVRAFMRFLDRRRLLPPDLSYEFMKDGVSALVGKMHYATPRVNDDTAKLVVYVKSLPVPTTSDPQAPARLSLLRDKAIILTLYTTGMRRAEISALNRADLQDGRAQDALVTGKGEKERMVFFDEEALLAIRTYLEARGDTHRALFIRHDDGRGKPGPRGEDWRLSPQTVWGVVKKYAKLAGVDATTHNLRHLKARTLLNNGAQLAEVQDILGHASPETTKRIYAPYTAQHLREAFDRFSVPAEELVRRTQLQSEEGETHGKY